MGATSVRVGSLAPLQLEIRISNANSHGILARLTTARRASFLPALGAKVSHFFGNRRVIRYSIISLNMVLLAGIGGFLLLNTKESQLVTDNAVLSAAGGDSAAVPLDQLSSADIAANAAVAAGLAETTAALNQADSIRAEVAAAPADTTTISKPQAVSTALKSRKDIKEYVTAAGDTVASIASKFNVTSDSIMWSNNLRGNTLNAGQKLYIPPVNGIVYTVASGDTVDSLSSKYRANKEQIIAYNDAEINGIKVGERILIPNGQQPVAVSYAYSTGFAFGSSPIYGFNGYIPGWCTWYVASKISVPTNWGNANTWDSGARASGWTVSSIPVVGAIGQTDRGSQGHVGIVEAVSEDGTMIKYSDMNGLAGFNRVGYSDWVPANSRFQNYIYH
jgi:surface antigen